MLAVASSRPARRMVLGVIEFTVCLFRIMLPLGRFHMVHEALSIQPQNAAELHELSRILKLGSPALIGFHGEKSTLPTPIYDLLKDIVRNLENGRSLVVIPEERQLTTQQAAELLTVPLRTAVKRKPCFSKRCQLVAR
jgi:hypothetical protein